MRFFLQDNTSLQIDEILKSLNSYMDGDISHQMQQKGLTYKKNFGVSILWLRKLAKKYKGDNALAERLWHREIRETMIIATLIANPDKRLLSKINEWIPLITSSEIAEQLGSNLLWKIPDIYSRSIQWLKDPSSIKHQGATWVSLATYLQRNNKFTSEQITMLLSILKNSFQTQSMFLLRVQGRFLRQACRTSAQYLSLVEQLITELKQSFPSNILIEDVESEIIFLKQSDLN
jgi:3-methyladenine DNA glycosylase AlkD